MGVGYTVRCESCGWSKDVLIGSGMLPPEHFREYILNGDFGQDAKEYLENNPDAGYLVEQIPYGCKCGYVTSFSEVIFYSDSGKIRMDSHRCCHCRAKMRRNNWGSGSCWKCGGKLSMLETIRWD